MVVSNELWDNTLSPLQTNTSFTRTQSCSLHPKHHHYKMTESTREAIRCLQQRKTVLKQGQEWGKPVYRACGKSEQFLNHEPDCPDFLSFGHQYGNNCRCLEPHWIFALQILISYAITVSHTLWIIAQALDLITIRYVYSLVLRGSTAPADPELPARRLHSELLLPSGRRSCSLCFLNTGSLNLNAE